MRYRIEAETKDLGVPLDETAIILNPQNWSWVRIVVLPDDPPAQEGER